MCERFGVSLAIDGRLVLLSMRRTGYPLNINGISIKQFE